MSLLDANTTSADSDILHYFFIDVMCWMQDHATLRPMFGPNHGSWILSDGNLQSVPPKRFRCWVDANLFPELPASNMNTTLIEGSYVNVDVRDGKVNIIPLIPVLPIVFKNVEKLPDWLALDRIFLTEPVLRERDDFEPPHKNIITVEKPTIIWHQSPNCYVEGCNNLYTNYFGISL